MINPKNYSENLSKEFGFIFLGNTSFKGLPQREHSLANELAQRGYSITFVEGMPSWGLKIKESLYSFIFNYHIPNQINLLPLQIAIAVPPLVPTFFRSSYVPKLDAKIFSNWFQKKFSNFDWNKTILIATFPYWWNGFFSRKQYPAKLLVYDICDSLEVHSRNAKTLNRMQKAEQALIKESDLISYSANEMGNELSSKSFIEKICIPNAVSTKFFNEMQNFPNSNKTKIGFIGALDPRWIDLKLIERAIERFPKYTFSFIAPFRRKFNKSLLKFPNVELLGFKNHLEIPRILSDFKVAIIPFLKNSITDSVNPLKLYEYCAAGVSIVAIRTKELEHYSDIVELADTHEEFLKILENALNDNDTEKRFNRIKFAQENTWQKRIDLLLKTINQKLFKE